MRLAEQTDIPKALFFCQSHLPSTMRLSWYICCPLPDCAVNVRKVELLALKEVQLGSNTNISHVQNERLIMQAVPPHQFVVGMLYAFRTPRLVFPTRTAGCVAT